MAVRTCYRCVYVRIDPDLWLRQLAAGQPVMPQCANHPQWPGHLREVPVVPCANYRPQPAEPTGDVRRIPLGDGHYALVDASDYDWLSRYNWRRQNGYAARREKGKTTYMHREITRPPKGMTVDHTNHNKCDNRRTNLRVCTHQQNVHNSDKQPGASSQFKGVGYSKDRRKWFAKIWFEGERIWLGYHLDEIDAAKAYDAAAVQYFGEFAHLNFPDDWPQQRRP